MPGYGLWRHPPHPQYLRRLLVIPPPPDATASPAAVVVTATVQAPAVTALSPVGKIENLHDNFVEGFGYPWDNDVANDASVVGGQLVLSGAVGSYVEGDDATDLGGGSASYDVWDLTESSILCEFLPADPSDINLQEFGVFTWGASGSAASFYVAANNLTAETFAAWGSASILNTDPYSPTNHRWLRISLAGSTLTFATSPDGSAWTTFATDTLDAGDLLEAAQVAPYFNNPSASDLVVDNVNSPPRTAVVVTTTIGAQTENASEDAAAVALTTTIQAPAGGATEDAAAAALVLALGDTTEGAGEDAAAVALTTTITAPGISASEDGAAVALTTTLAAPDAGAGEDAAATVLATTLGTPGGSAGEDEGGTSAGIFLTAPNVGAGEDADAVLVTIQVPQPDASAGGTNATGEPAAVALTTTITNPAGNASEDAVAVAIVVQLPSGLVLYDGFPIGTSIAEDFSGGLGDFDSPGVTSGVSVVAGQLAVDADSAPYAETSLRSLTSPGYRVADLTGAALHAEITGIDLTDQGQIYWLGLYAPYTDTATFVDYHELAFDVTWDGGAWVLEAYYITPGYNRTVVASATYNASTHRWLRLREASGTVFWDTSTDGSSWSNLGSTALHGWSATDLTHVVVYISSSASGTDDWFVDNVNFTFAQPAAVPVSANLPTGGGSASEAGAAVVLAVTPANPGGNAGIDEDGTTSGVFVTNPAGNASEDAAAVAVGTTTLTAPGISASEDEDGFLVTINVPQPDATGTTAGNGQPAGVFVGATITAPAISASELEAGFATGITVGAATANAGEDAAAVAVGSSIQAPAISASENEQGTTVTIQVPSGVGGAAGEPGGGGIGSTLTGPAGSVSEDATAVPVVVSVPQPSASGSAATTPAAVFVAIAVIAPNAGAAGAPGAVEILISVPLAGSLADSTGRPDAVVIVIRLPIPGAPTYGHGHGHAGDHPGGRPHVGDRPLALSRIGDHRSGIVHADRE